MKSFTDSIAFIDEEAERLKTALLYRNSSMAQVVNVVASAALAYINVNLDAPVFWAVCWWLSMVSVSAARLMLARQFVRNSPSAFQAPAWRRRFIIVTGLMTTVWAVGAVLFVWNASDTARLFTGLVLSGMVAGALPLLAPVPLAFRLFCGRHHGADGLGAFFASSIRTALGFWWLDPGLHGVHAGRCQLPA
jgi:hypothetical protein